jgi:GNAT superfamily N-acetyltransferase
MVIKGDEVVESGTGYIHAIIGEPAAADAVHELLSRVVRHVRRYRPKKIVAQDGCLTPVFCADSASTLSFLNAWIGQVLVDTGFVVCARSLRLVAPLDRARRPVVAPSNLKFFHLKHEMYGFDPKYDFGCLLLKPPYEHGDGVVWCGNFYSGAFVKGMAHRSLHINWFTIMDEAYRGKGLGRLMLQYCLYEAQKRGATYASLLTTDDNFVAHNLYQSEGFQPVDISHSFQLRAPER